MSTLLNETWFFVLTYTAFTLQLDCQIALKEVYFNNEVTQSKGKALHKLLQMQINNFAYDCK